MAEYIERGALEELVKAHFKREIDANLYSVDTVDTAGAMCSLIGGLPAADVAPVKPELKKTVGLLNAYYEKGLKNPIVRDPLAWALFQTWKTVNRGDRA